MSLREAIKLGRDRYHERLAAKIKLKAFLYMRYYQVLDWQQAMIMAEMEMRYGTGVYTELP